MSIKSKLASLSALFVATVLIGMAPPEAMAGKKGQVDVCHQGQTLNINGNALQAHLNHGDIAGDCNAIVRTEWLDLRCDTTTTPLVFTITNVSASASLTTLPSLLVGNCAEAQKAIQAALCQLNQSFGTADAQVYVYNCPAG